MNSCNGNIKNEHNPFFDEVWDTPYGVPPFDKIRIYHYLPAFEQAMSLNNAEIDAIVSSHDEPDFDNTIVAYDRSGEMLSRVINVFSMLAAAETSPEMQEIEVEIMPQLSAHFDKIRMNAALFQRINTVYQRRNSLDLTPEQIRLTEKIYNSFVRSGALLDSDQKARLAEINEALSTASVRFSNNILAENNNFQLVLKDSDLEGIPSSVRDAARLAATNAQLGDGKYLFTLHKPSLIPFLNNSKRRDLREQIYKAYFNRCNNGDEYDNKALINEMTRLRCEKAHLLGYKSYSDFVISDQMAQKVESAYALLEDIFAPANKKAREELEEMMSLFFADNPGEKFESWDWWYYAEQVRKQKYSLNEETLRPYFSLENVLHGVFNLANRLYALTFRPMIVPIYHSEVSAYEVLDADGSHLGVLYFDFFPRSGKGQGAWCGYFREGAYDAEGKRITPVVSIVCNFPRPTTSAPSLLSLDDVATLFHEFGHALHFLFTDVRYNGLREVEGDFVELPSQIMENWAFEPEILQSYAIHHRTSEVIPNASITRIRNAAQFNQGFETTELVAAALSDLDIHSIENYTELDVDAFEYQALYEKRNMITQIEPRYHYTYFAHIFSGGYSSGYYFYIWAEVLDKDAFEAFRETDNICDRATALRFRNEVLARGGSADGMSLYTAFRGREPKREPMLKARGILALDSSTDEESQPEPIPDNEKPVGARIDFDE